MPLVSIVIPAWNTAPWIEEAIRSALAQTLEDLEVIVVDDGSTDGTGDRAAGIRDSRLRVERQEHLGICAARNAGVHSADAQYIAFLDSDDVWLPQKLAAHVEAFAAHDEVDLTFSWSALIDEQSNLTGHAINAPAGPASFEDVLTRDLLGNGSCAVVRRAALDRAGPFDTTLRASTDHDMWLRIALLRPANMWCIPQPLTLYRRRAGQVTGSWEKALSETGKVMEKMRRLAPGMNATTWDRAEVANYRSYAYMAYDNAESVPAMRLLVRAFESSPWFAARDGRTWSLGFAILARMLLPGRVFHWLRGLRASTNKLSSGRLSSNSTSGSSPS